MNEGEKQRDRGTLFNIFYDLFIPRRPRRGHSWTVPSLGMEMVWVAPGSFMMGSLENENGRAVGEVFHHVTLTHGFWLGKFPITQAQWEFVTGHNPSKFGKAGGNAPVENVSWNEAIDFCRAISKEEHHKWRLPVGYRYGLPTEAQWEYACRAGSIGPYGGTGVLDEMGWYYDNAEKGRENPVGLKKPNAWGLYDMHGNVCEWCSDVYGEYPSDAVVDPTGPTEGVIRVNRGGSNCSIARYCRSAMRFSDGQSNRLDDLGFRLALIKTP